MTAQAALRPARAEPDESARASPHARAVASIGRILVGGEGRGGAGRGHLRSPG